MAGIVNPKFAVYIDDVDYTSHVSNINVNHEVQTLSPTFTVFLSKNLPITGGEIFAIHMGYGNTLVPMLTGGTISTFSRTLTQNGVEFVVNGRGPFSMIIDDAPELDQIYIPTWDKSYNSDGEWVSAACGIQRTEPVPPGIDPKQDPDEYEIFEGDWYVHTLLKDIIEDKLNMSVVLNIPDAKYRETFRINRSQTWLSAIQQLVSVWDPIIFMNGNTIYILDTDMALPESSNITYGSSSCIVTNINYTKNNIVNRVLIKGGADESVVPTKTETWVPQIDLIQEFMGEDLSAHATEITASEHPTPSSGTGFTGSRIYQAYFKPMFGDPIHIYTRTVNYYNDHILKVMVELNYFRSTGTYGPDQQVCTKVFKKRRQEFVTAGYFTSTATPTYVSIGEVYIERGFSGSGNTGTDAAEPDGQAIIPVYFGGYNYIKVLDQEEMLDAAVGDTFATATSRTFGIMPKAAVRSIQGGDPVIGTYYLIGGAPVIDPKSLYIYQRINGYTLSYRIIQEKVVTTDVKTSSMALKQTQIFDYTKMTSDYSTPEIATSGEVVPINSSNVFVSNKKPVYQYEEYFEDLPSINIHGYKPVITYYDPSIINTSQATILKNKIFAKSGRIEQEITIQPTIGNPLLSVGKSLILESATYKQINFALWESTGTQVYEDTTIEGGNYIINGIRHNFTNQGGFKTEISLRKLWKLVI